MFSDVMSVKDGPPVMCASFPINDDDLCEGPESFFVTLTGNGANVGFDGPRSGTVNIIDNDGTYVLL